MKQKLLIVSVIFLSQFTTYAETTIFSNSEGCVVEKEQRRNGVILYLSKGDQQQVVGFTNDYQLADFVYCADDKTEINYLDGSLGTGIMISCNGHRNGHAVTRGRVDISLDTDGNPTEVKIDGQKKGLFTWKQKTLIECNNLVQE
ncbi:MULTISPECIES: hypothetical protein [Halobacteriovorax]|uniref:Uncharacterized protein n=1 Tax=Halobacteriovorax vibrionivorans TaxID=2152716 RepID=A0ABY0IGJ5_9BACT|nr:MULTISPECIES: hypothetical protein [Halobacteriovorax]RZF21620.1 hypothetical protein DAY19_07995 [Halobacteriovorax vibrionivorans]TGD49087.1 hypothetical protein EP118_01055 [Halobacteriovorax sp. Y22]